jgi:hypothetical protein
LEITITRKGQVTQLTRKLQQNNCVISFKGGYCKFVYDDKDLPDGAMLEDPVEISIIFKIKEE